jgi:hypothetical protein
MKHWKLDDDSRPDEAFGRYAYRIGWKFAVALALGATMWVAVYFSLRWFWA